MRVPNYALEKSVKKDIDDGLSYKEIAEKNHISTRYIYNILKKHQTIKPTEKKSEKNTTTKKITEILSLRLIYYCNDLDLLNAMFKENFKKFSGKKIEIPERVKKIGLEEKIKKIMNFS